MSTGHFILVRGLPFAAPSTKESTASDCTFTTNFDDDAAAQNPGSDRVELTENETGADDAVEASTESDSAEKNTVTMTDGADEGTHTGTTAHTEHR